MMKIIFLGTGTSTGVPEIGCHCEVCTSKDPRDKRFRTSALIEIAGKNILIDCGPDFRCQMLANDVSRVDAVLITHEHYDHVSGIDDLRPLAYKKNLKIYAEDNVATAIEKRMPYAFCQERAPGVVDAELVRIDENPFEILGVPITPIRLMHANLPILGYRIGKLAYLTDLKYIPESEFEKLTGLDVLVIEALHQYQHISHETVDDALVNIARIAPERAYLVHMSHRIGLHAEAQKALPEQVFYAYDGLQLEIKE
jgi:phosphoribosyl 1,2-cyclic phosphate phosphodiesterase